MKELDQLIDKICISLEENDTLENYIKVMRCCCECFKLLDWNFLEKEEIKNITQGIEIWKNNDYNSNLLEKLYLKTARNKCSNKKMEIKRSQILDLGVNLLFSYERWSNVYHRPHMLEYFISDIVDVGVEEKSILPIVKKFFSI